MRFTLLFAVALAAACSKKSGDAGSTPEESAMRRFERQGGLELVLRETKPDTPCARAGRSASPVEEVIRRRFDAFGLAPDIRRGTGGEIVVRVAGDDARHRETIEQILAPGGCLTFREVDDTADLFGTVEVAGLIEAHNGTAAAQERVERFTDRQRRRLRSKSKAALEHLVADLRARGSLPADRVIGYELDPKKGTHATLLLHAETPLTGAAVVEAKVGLDSLGYPIISATLSEAGGAALGRLTRSIVGRRLAICVDDRVASAPVVKEAITGGRFQISMGSMNTEAALARSRVLAARLVGAPLPVERVRTTTVAPAGKR